ncbi:hypothetical protein HF285_02150, partial [Acidithiobacillus ferrooxidans F221]
MGWFEFRSAFEDFVENKVFTSVESLGRSIERVGDSAVEKLGGAIDNVSENPGKTALIVGAAVATGGVAFVAAPAVAAAAGGAGLLGAASTGT